MDINELENLVESMGMLEGHGKRFIVNVKILKSTKSAKRDDQTDQQKEENICTKKREQVNKKDLKCRFGCILL